MHRLSRTHRKPARAAVLALFACLAVSALPAFGQDEADAVKIPTVYREAYKITVKGKADANGTFSMVFKPHGGDPTELTVNVVKGMGAKAIARDLTKELTLAAGANYKVKHNDKKVIVKRANKKQPTLAIEMTNQKITGVSIMIGKN
jgi:hypothetical protein